MKMSCRRNVGERSSSCRSSGRVGFDQQAGAHVQPRAGSARRRLDGETPAAAVAKATDQEHPEALAAYGHGRAQAVTIPTRGFDRVESLAGVGDTHHAVPDRNFYATFGCVLDGVAYQIADSNSNHGLRSLDDGGLQVDH